MDFYLFQAIHAWVGRSPFLDGSMIFLAQWLTPLIIIIFAVVGIEQLWRARKLPLPLVALIAGFVAWLLQYSISLAFFFPRPFAVLGFNPLISHNPFDSSFPSGHASFLFGLAWYIFLIEPKKIKGIMALSLAMLISVARIYAGVHWPLDIVGGICVGVLSSCLVYLVLQRFRASRLHHVPKIIRW